MKRELKSHSEICLNMKKLSKLQRENNEILENLTGKINSLYISERKLIEDEEEQMALKRIIAENDKLWQSLIQGRSNTFQEKALLLRLQDDYSGVLSKSFVFQTTEIAREISLLFSQLQQRKQISYLKAKQYLPRIEDSIAEESPWKEIDLNSPEQRMVIRGKKSTPRMEETMSYSHLNNNVDAQKGLRNTNPPQKALFFQHSIRSNSGTNWLETAPGQAMQKQLKGSGSSLLKKDSFEPMSAKPRISQRIKTEVRNVESPYTIKRTPSSSG